MKKLIVALVGFIFILAIPMQGYAENQVNSEVGIQFYQPTAENKIVPMEKMTAHQEYPNGEYPKTNEVHDNSFSILGWLFLCLFLLFYKRRGIRHAFKN